MASIEWTIKVKEDQMKLYMSHDDTLNVVLSRDISVHNYAAKRPAAHPVNQ